MATKQELEVQVAELQKQLADQTPHDVDLLQAEIENLKTERELLVAAIADKDEANKTKIDTLISEFEQTRQEDEAVYQGKLSNLKAEMTATSVKSAIAGNNQVVVDGKTREILFKDSVLELVDAWRKKFVDETDLAVVIRKV